MREELIAIYGPLIQVHISYGLGIVVRAKVEERCRQRRKKGLSLERPLPQYTYTC
jgi:hypothetical protein